MPAITINEFERLHLFLEILVEEGFEFLGNIIDENFELPAGDFNLRTFGSVAVYFDFNQKIYYQKIISK